MCIDLAADMTNVEQKLNTLLPKKIDQIRTRETRLISQKYYNVMSNTQRFKNSQILWIKYFVYFNVHSNWFTVTRTV